MKTINDYIYLSDDESSNFKHVCELYKADLQSYAGMLHVDITLDIMQRIRQYDDIRLSEKQFKCISRAFAEIDVNIMEEIE